MTKCGEDEFTCEHGSCVPMDVRCDGKKDCVDGTDEAQCIRIKAYDGYNKKLSPVPLDGHDRFFYNIYIHIRKIIFIDVIGGKLKMKMSDSIVLSIHEAFQ